MKRVQQSAKIVDSQKSLGLRKSPHKGWNAPPCSNNVRMPKDADNVSYLGKLCPYSNLPMRLGISFISSLKTTDKRHILAVTSDTHQRAVTHENNSKSSIGMIHMTNPHINAKMPLSLLWQHEQSAYAYAYAKEGFLKKQSLVLETSAIIRLEKYIFAKSHIS